MGRVCISSWMRCRSRRRGMVWGRGGGAGEEEQKEVCEGKGKRGKEKGKRV